MNENTTPEASANGIPPRPSFEYPRPPAEAAHVTSAQPTVAYPTQPVFGFNSHLAPGSGGHPGFTPPVTAGPTVEKKPSNTGRWAAVVLAAALVGGGFGLGAGYLGGKLENSPSSVSSSGPSSITVNNPGSVNETTAIATEVLPSVVTLDVTGGSGAGNGSGVVISKDGYVLTNTHVVTLGGAEAKPTIRVTASDGKIYNATIVGTDPIYDLAVIKLEGATDLPPIDFADSSKLNVGSTAVALGAPLGLSNSVTTGIVSALNRSIQIQSSAAPNTGTQDQQEQENTEEGESPFQFDLPGQTPTPKNGDTITISVIQTDAAINPGNSGGALVDSEGKLIGINVAIATAGGAAGETGSIGVGFAIPSNVAERVAKEIIETGAATHGLLGASVSDASSVETATVAGAYIEEVVAGGAAEQAKLAKGDIVTKFNGASVSNASDLTAQVRAAAAGSTATVTYVREGKAYDIDVKLGKLAV